MELMILRTKKCVNSVVINAINVLLLLIVMDFAPIVPEKAMSVIVRPHFTILTKKNPVDPVYIPVKTVLQSLIVHLVKIH